MRCRSGQPPSYLSNTKKQISGEGYYRGSILYNKYEGRASSSIYKVPSDLSTQFPPTPLCFLLWSRRLSCSSDAKMPNGQEIPHTGYHLSPSIFTLDPKRMHQPRMFGMEAWNTWAWVRLRRHLQQFYIIWRTFCFFFFCFSFSSLNILATTPLVQAPRRDVVHSIQHAWSGVNSSLKRACNDLVKCNCDGGWNVGFCWNFIFFPP
jgi:hypothetical protein